MFKRSLVILFIFLIGTLFAQEVENSNRYTSTFGLVTSDWDQMLMPSESLTIDKDFFYLPFGGSLAFQEGHYRLGGSVSPSFLESIFPRVLFYADIMGDSSPFVGLMEDYQIDQNWVDSDDTDLVPDVYEKTLYRTGDSPANQYSGTDMAFSLGIPFPGEGFSWAVRPYFSSMVDSIIHFEMDTLNTTQINYLEDSVSGEYVAVTEAGAYRFVEDDSSVSLQLNDSSLLIGVAAGAVLDTPVFLLKMDLFTDFTTFGDYNAVKTDREWFFDSSNLGTEETPGVFATDYKTREISTTVTQGFMNFSSLTASSLLFTPGDTVLYDLSDSTGLLSGYQVNVPHSDFSMGCSGSADLGWISVPFFLGFNTASIDASFQKIAEDTDFANDTGDISSYSKTTTQLDITTEGMGRFNMSVGVEKKWENDQIAFGLGLNWRMDTLDYQLKVDQTVVELTQADTDLTDEDTETNEYEMDSTTTHSGYFKAYDYSEVIHTISLPIGISLQINEVLSLFGGYNVAFLVGESSGQYIDSAGYEQEVTTNNLLDDTDPNKNFVSTFGYVNNPYGVRTTSPLRGITQQLNFGASFSLGSCIEITTEIFSYDPGANTQFPGFQNLLDMNLAAEIQVRLDEDLFNEASSLADWWADLFSGSAIETEVDPEIELESEDVLLDE